MNPKDYQSHNDGEETRRQLAYIDRLTECVTDLKDGLGRAPKACVVTFGCQMNARDSEKLLGILLTAGYEETEDEADADLILYNTCSVRDNANQRVYGRLGVLKGYKKSKPWLKVVLCGCMMQEETCVNKIRTSYSFVDLIFGTHNIFKFAELMCDTFDASGHMITQVWDETDKIVEELPVKRKYAYKSGVNIMFGCNNFCTYCIVPYVRGRERSRAPEEILCEIRQLVNDGVIEVMLLGQNVNSYGTNLDDPISFAQLLREVEEIDGLKRIRFMTSHPKDLSDELIDVCARSEKICRHIHLPVQTGSDSLLKAMNRSYTRDHYLALVDRIRTAIPDISITTDLIMGFPGETSADVDDTIDLIRRVGFDNAYTFEYSKRTGTPAASMEGQLSPEEMQSHFDAVLKVVQETARQSAAKHTGEVCDALIETVSDHDDGLVTGRLSNNLLVHLPGDASMIGSIVPVRLDVCKGFYFLGSKI
ncbi:MAG: tRNA (N6-isopentenyl adenosine(37)-C2)-methylthiotransferase MiaB [Lachnospiraceae bacterium]|nr:tRNA (N6-isopentenyl adenosine(37)-C2)-methylthiotransferase MiaB [Lachnospiraceae bacterium]